MPGIGGKAAESAPEAAQSLPSFLGSGRHGIWSVFANRDTLSCSPFQAAGTYIPCLSSKPFSAAATGRGRRHDHETTVDHALMRGLVTAGPVMRRGASV